MDFRKFRALSKDWEALGDTDPLFGVLSDPAKRGGKWEAGEFFASGRAHVDELLRTLGDLRVSYEKGTCLDFGCGVGRLTFPLSESFAHTVGVDVAQSMIDPARRFLRPGDRCEFVVNRDPDLRWFPTATFDFVHSCLVLQHIPPEISMRYIGELFRVAKPGGLVVFQLPADTISERDISAANALPDSAYRARIVIADPPAVLGSSEFATLRLVVTNNSDVTWRHDIPGGRHICAGNHWLTEDGTAAIQDDGRAFLPRTIGPGESVEMLLNVQAPAAPGRYVLDIDLVREHVCWFAQKGSPTARAAIAVDGVQPGSRSAAPPAPPPAGPAPRTDSAHHAPAARMSIVQRIARRFRGGTPSFEMHVVPRQAVEQAIAASGGALLRAINDNAAGAGWVSYTYVCRRLARPPA